MAIPVFHDMNTNFNLGLDDISLSPVLKVCVLASGSKGNSIYISNGRASLLFDAGLSGKEIERRMAERQLDPKKLTGIVVSHEHSDHVRGVGVLSRRYQLPVYISPKTDQAASGQVGKLYQTSHFSCGESFYIEGLSIRPFSISHDAVDPAGFTISNNGRKVGLATDLGVATGMVKEHLKECNLLIIEANHDADMLINGPYPWHLKQRIKSRTGHLSNDDSNHLLRELQHNGLVGVVLAHLSEQNNDPKKALRTVRDALSSRLCEPEFYVAGQDVSSEVIDLI